MKIAILAPSLHLPESWAHWLDDVFRELGHETTLIDYRALAELGAINAARQILSSINSFEPELTLVVKGEKIPTVALKNLGGFKILWANDDPQLYKTISSHLAPYFDYVLTSSEDCIPSYKKLGVKAEYMPFFCHPRLHYQRDKKAEFDVCYVGTYYPDRVEIIRALREKFNLGLFGDQWDEKLFGKVVRLPYEDVLNAWCGSKIVLNISQPPNRFGSTKATLRIFEALACGCFVLSDHMRRIEDLFQLGKHLDVYESMDELLEKTEYYLSQEVERKRIAEAGMKEVLAKHTSRHRAERILEIYESYR